MLSDAALSNAKGAIVAVGSRRGFVVQRLQRHERLIITAAHCLPTLPTAEPFVSGPVIYSQLVGPLNDTLRVDVECLFVDPIADVAVLGPPRDDNAADAYATVVESGTVLQIGVISEHTEAALFTFDGRLETCAITVANRYAPSQGVRLLVAATGDEDWATAGSPILGPDGRALAIVMGSKYGPLLASTLPLWLLSELDVDVVHARDACRTYVDALRQLAERNVPITAGDGVARVTGPTPPYTTGLVCPQCRQPVAQVERTTTGLLMQCPACGNRWSATPPGAKPH